MQEKASDQPIRTGTKLQILHGRIVYGLQNTGVSFINSSFTCGTAWLTSSLSHPIISPKDTCWQRQYVGSSGSIGSVEKSGWGIGRIGANDSRLDCRELEDNIQKEELVHALFISVQKFYLFFTLTFFLGGLRGVEFALLPAPPTASLGLDTASLLPGTTTVPSSSIACICTLSWVIALVRLCPSARVS